MLARNDTNKKLLVELGALELLVELAKGDVEEQIGIVFTCVADCCIYHMKCQNLLSGKSKRK